MKRTNLITLLSSMIVIGIFVLTAPLLTSCESECDHGEDTITCADSLKAEHDCEHHKKEHKCDHHKSDSTKCCKHGDKDQGCCDMAKMKEERIAFDELLTEEEKAEIARIKAIFAEIDHETTKCEDVQEKYAEEIASLQAIADAHAEDFEPICPMKHHADGDKEHKCKGHHGDKEMTEEEMKEHCNQFKIHFLVMDCEEEVTEEPAEEITE